MAFHPPAGGSGGTVTSVSSANGDIAVANGTTTPTLTLNSSTTASASKIVKYNTNSNISTNNVLNGYTTTATAGGTTTLTVGSTYHQYFTGSSNQTVVLPDATTLVLGQAFRIHNNSTGTVTIQTNGGATLWILAAGTQGITVCTSIGSTAGTWDVEYLGVVAGTGKKVTINNSVTFQGTDNTTFTLPSTTGTLARTDAAQTFTGTQTFSQTVLTANAITASGNAATVPVTSGRNIVTNNSAATLTITMTTTSAVNMQTCIVQILDFSAVAQTITWVNTENSGVSAPTTSNGSTTLPLTVGFIYNSATSKWRCIASA